MNLLADQTAIFMQAGTTRQRPEGRAMWGDDEVAPDYLLIPKLPDRLTPIIR
jgi:hypothetical protein